MKASPVCPYLSVEKTAQRIPGHEFERPDRYDVERLWYCRHPFHGVDVLIGVSEREALQRCAVCTLQREGDEA
jgi:hypothetical protein